MLNQIKMLIFHQWIYSYSHDRLKKIKIKQLCDRNEEIFPITVCILKFSVLKIQ